MVEDFSKKKSPQPFRCNGGVEMKKFSIFSVFIILLTVSFTLLTCSIGFIHILNIDKKSLSMDNGNVFISLQHESNPLYLPDSPKTLSDFNTIYSDLKDNSLFTYYEIYRQHLDFSAATDTLVTDDLLSQSPSQVSCVQISRNVQSDFSLKLESGTYLPESSFVLKNNDTIKVLMGYDYSTIYKIGDTFSANYLYSPFTFEVIGFLAQNSEISISTGSIPLDTYIIMPSFTFSYSPASDTEYVTQKIHFANKTSGKIKTNEGNYDASMSYVKSTMENSKVGEYSITTSSSEKNFLLNGLNLRILLLVCSVFSCLFAIFSLYIGAKFIINYIKSDHPIHCFLVSIPLVSIPAILAAGLSFFFMIMLGIYQRIGFTYIVTIALFYLVLSFILLKARANSINK